MLVHFFELSGPDARDRLKRFQDSLLACDGAASVSFLQSLEQEHLYLLMVTSKGKLELSPPEGTRVWHFRTDT